MSHSLTTVWSCGGGVQSAAIAALIVNGRLPKPDIAVMADTGREKSTTWAYLNTVIKPELETVGVNLVVVHKNDWRAPDLTKSQGRDIILPYYTDRDGQKSKMPTFCSSEWKQRPVRRYLRSLGVERCQMWLGMSVDEMQRTKVADVQWIENYYPLIQYLNPAFRRSDCLYAVADIGWPEPPRSACWMCPNMGDHEWRLMKSNTPRDFDNACNLEDQLRLQDPNLWFHRTCKPLRSVNFDAEPSVFDMEDGCGSGHCFV